MTFILVAALAALVDYSHQAARLLNDENFEHDTQATTGSTTGPWFLMFCDSNRPKDCSEEVKEIWDDVYDRLFGTATAAYIDIQDSRQTQRRFGVQYNELPQIFYIHRGKYYRYQVVKEGQPQQTKLSADELVKFVTEGQYEDIPGVFPQDHGDIPGQPSLFDGLIHIVKHEIETKGGLVNFLLMKDDRGNINYYAFGLIYSALLLAFATICYVLLDAKREFSASAGSKPKKGTKVKSG